MPKLKTSWVILGILVVILLYVWGAYNGFVSKNETVSTTWAQVENQYQRRIDLIPNLVETVKGYAKHESSVFEAVTTARAQVGSMTVTPEILENPTLFKKFDDAQAGLSSALSRLFAVAENYPALKASENFLTLQSQLEGTENRIATERMRFNDAVKALNIRIKRFPGNIVAGLFGFSEKAYFEATAGAENSPEVKF